MKYCDINCDMGEGIGNDEQIMPYISSANIACGYHAGDETTMMETIKLAQKYHVNIGAHPSFPDRDNFGRLEMKMSSGEVYDLIIIQIDILQKIADRYNAKVSHVKPHGALYNLACKEKTMARTIARSVYDYDKNLILYGLSNSFLISESKSIGLQTAEEVFADRTFTATGTLTPRSEANALITDIDQSIEQVLKIISEGKVQTTSGNEIEILGETICIHGDGKNAALFAKTIKEALLKHNIMVCRSK